MCVQPLSSLLEWKHVSAELPVTDLARGVTFSRNEPLSTFSPAELRLSTMLGEEGGGGVAFQIRGINK